MRLSVAKLCLLVSVVGLCALPHQPNAAAATTVPLNQALGLSTTAANNMQTAVRNAEIEKAKRPTTGPLSKLSQNLDDLRNKVTQQAQLRQAAVGTNRQLWKLQGMSVPQFSQVAVDGAIQVYVHTKTVADSHDTQLQALGMRDALSVPSMKVIQGWLPHDQIQAAAALDFVARVDLPGYGMRRTGSVNTQGDALLRANLVRQMGPPGPWTGAGIRVGVVSDGMFSRAASSASGDLPASITVHPTLSGGTLLPYRDEGTAMCEIIYDMAPGVQFFFAGYNPNRSPQTITSAEMVTAIGWLATNQNCNVICDDLGFPGEPYFQDGAIAIAARDAVVNSGRVYVSAAGNDAKNHYQGLFTDGGFGWHNFKAGGGLDTGLDIFVTNGVPVQITLQWDDAFGASANDYDLYIIDPLTGGIVAQSNNRQAGTDNPLEYLTYTPPGAGTGFRTLRAYIKRVAGVAKTLELFTYQPAYPRAEITDGNHVPTDSIFGHAAVPEVISCAAINATNVGLNTIAYYSSRGPSTIVYNTNGVYSPEVRQTPFITAVDGVNITGAGGFGTLTNGLRYFFGTSASAPHVAAICALLLDRRPISTPAEIRATLAATAIDKGPAGYDNTYGYGLIDALAGINQIVTPVAQFAVSSQSAPENGPWVQVVINLSTQAGETITIPYTVGGTATQGADYYIYTNGIVSANVFTIPAGASVGTNTFIAPVDDSLPEWEETVVLTMGTPTNCTLGARTVYTLSITDDDSPLVTNIIDGTTVNWPGTYIVGDNDTFNALIITNAGVLNDTIGLIGNMGSALNNRVYVTGAGSLWQNSDSLIVGAAGSSNRLTLDNAATVLASNIVIGASPGATSNQINVVGGILAATNALGGGALDVRRGVLSLNGGTVTADHLYASNGPGSVVNVYTGTLDTRNTTINNGSQFRVGDGFGAATLHLNGGTHSFANGLFINTNAMLTGTGAISGAIVSAGTIAPGDSAGMITGDSNLTLLSSAVLSMGLGGTAPSLYDQLDIAGTFNFGGTLTVSLESGFMPNVADRFDLFDFSATSGAFSQLNLANLLLTEYWYDGLLYTTGELVVGDRQFAWMVTPTDGTTLASTSQTFVWDGGTGVTYYGLWIGTAPLTYNIHASVESGKSRTVTTLPSDGMPLYVTLWAFVNGVWQQGHTYTYLAATSTKAAMLTPVNGTTLSTATPTFTWNAGVSVKYYALWIGNNPGTYDIYAGLEPGLSRTLLVPSDGRTLCVTLWSFINGAWQSNAYTYTAPTAQSAQMISPADGTVLSSDRIVFNWDAGVGVTQYGLWVGNNPATYDLHASAQTGLSQTVKLPTDGRAIYVTLWSLINGAWQSNPYSYTAVTATVPVRSQMLTPTPGSTLPGATVTFTWSGGVGVTGNALWVGSSPGTYDLYSALEPGLSRTLTLPTDSRTLYITLWSWLTGVWAPVSYTCTYTAAPPPPPY